MMAGVTVDDTAVRELARVRDGVVSWDEAMAAGLTSRSIATRVARGSWFRLGRTIGVHEFHRPGDRSSAWTLHLHAGHRSLVSGPVAARLQGWDIPGSDHLIVSPLPVRPIEGLPFRVLRRSIPPVPTRRPGLPPLVRRSDALADTLITRSPRGARDLLDRALQQRWITADDLDRIVGERSGSGPRGLLRLRQMHARALSGSRSEAEQRLALLLRRCGGRWRANFPIRDDRGRTLAEIDFADPDLRIAIEVDGRAFHSDHGAFERDRARQNLLVLRGWVVLRFTWERIVGDPDEVVDEIMAAVRRAAST